MIISTELPNDEERNAALATVPWLEDVSSLAGEIYAACDNGAIDFIDASIGPSHCRAALVALLEGAGTLQQATIDLAESMVRHRVFSRIHMVAPLHPGKQLTPKEREGLIWRYSKLAVEDAAVRAASAGDHLANTHVRLAWEANAASLREVKACGFDPAKPEPDRWITAPQLRQGIRKAQKSELTSLLPDFVPNGAFFLYMDNEAIEAVRTFRDQVVHREKPAYREIPRLGRTTLWTRPAFSIDISPVEPIDENAPALGERHAQVGKAVRETMYYAQALWEHTKLWLPTIDVLIKPTPDGKVHIRTRHQVGRHSQRFPRANRDPGPFLRNW